MNDAELVLVMDQACDQAVRWVRDQLTSAGLQVVRTFDLQDARSAHFECTCPHHGTEQCDCQMVVLLVYGGSPAPLSLVAHGHDAHTWFYVVDTPQQRADSRLGATVRNSLIPSAPGFLPGMVPQVPG